MCELCPRLVAFRCQNQQLFPDFFNAPVPSFGDVQAQLLIVGLAPGLKGANRTGRPFTGDYAGILLYDTLKKFGFAQGEYKADPRDGFCLVNARIANAVRCVPPENKVTGSEIKTCNPLLVKEIAALPRLRVIVALGSVAHKAVCRAFHLAEKNYTFAHGKKHTLPHGLILIDCYHCSRYNTSTKRLTPDMFEAVFQQAQACLL